MRFQVTGFSRDHTATIGIAWDAQLDGWRVAIADDRGIHLVGPAYKRTEPAEGFARWLREAWPDILEAGDNG